MVIPNIMTAKWYVYDILQSHVLSLMIRLPEAIFQQDNARLHPAGMSQDYLPWPAGSPGLSPIKPIWDGLEEALEEVQ
ncbi:hypothetical protein TNCV_2514411 [Trichonephila clavipes]|nr:hypothetical protein TNCV_2514411 [Trichonephila clavipes]